MAVGIIEAERKETPIPDYPSSNDGPSQTTPKEPEAGTPRTLGLGGFLFELSLPVALSAALLLVIASYLPLWDLHSRTGLGVFDVLLVALSLLVSIRVDAFTLARRRKRGTRQILNRATARSRLVKFIIGGLVIPIVVLAAANWVELPNHRTPMSLAIQLSLPKPKVSRAEHLGNAVLRAENPAAKVQGILALQAMDSNEALEQLLRILSDDPAALKDGSEYQALSKALASFGAQAKPALLQRFGQVRPSLRRSAVAPSGDLFERYFSTAFEGLTNELSGQTLDPATQAAELARLQAAQAELRLALSRVEADTLSPRGNSNVPGFVMQTFLQMGLKQDADLLAFARQTAADDAWSDAVRGHALLLIAKLGGKDDLDGLYAYLDSRSAPLQARAMQAIGLLQAKTSAAANSR